MTPGLPPSLRQEAALLRLLHVMGLVNHATIVAWADAAILAMEQATDGITSLALANAEHPRVVVGLLGQLAAGADQELADRQALGLLRIRFHSGDVDGARTLLALQAYRTYRNFGVRDHAQEALLSDIDDEYELGLRGYPKSPDMVAQATSDFLDAYADENFDPALFSIL